MIESRGRAAAKQIRAEQETNEGRLDKILSLWGKPRPASQFDRQGCDGAAVRRGIEGLAHLAVRALAEEPRAATDDLVRERIIPLIEEAMLEGVAIGAALASPQAAAKRRKQVELVRAIMEALPKAEHDCRVTHGKIIKNVIDADVAKMVGCKPRMVEQVRSKRAAWKKFAEMQQRAADQLAEKNSG